MTNILFFISLIILPQVALSKGPDELIEGKKRAVLLITVHDKITGKGVFEGGGFFVDSKGHFITNHHVIRDFLQAPDKYLLRLQDAKEDEFDDVEILKCGNEQKIDLCYGHIRATKKIYFFDVTNRAPNKTQGMAIIGHNNSNHFSIRKGEVKDFVQNAGEKYRIPLDKRINLNVPMIEVGNYEYANGKCRGDSGSPVFDYFTGDLLGVFTECNTDKETREVHKLAIDTRAVYSFINTDSKMNYFKLPKDSIYKAPKETVKEMVEFGRGREFEAEQKNGKPQ